MKLGAVLMASGAGARFGSNKLLHPVDSVPMIQRAFAAVPPELFDRACVVSRYPEVYACGSERGYHAIFNPRAAEGQSTSIRLGLSALLEMDGVLFAVCDQPWLERTSVERLLEAFAACPDRICALSWQGKRGSPVMFPSEFFPQLLSLTGDQGGAGIIRANSHRLRLVEAGRPEELRDVDTPALLFTNKT